MSSGSGPKVRCTKTAFRPIEEIKENMAKRRPSVTFSDNIQEEVYITPTGIIEKTLPKTDRISMLRASQVSIDAGGTMTGSITKSQLSKISAAETPLTNLGTRKRCVTGDTHAECSSFSNMHNVWFWVYVSKTHLGCL